MRELKRKVWKDISKDIISASVKEYYEASESKCPVDRLFKFTEEAKWNSCGKCVICREGIYQINVITDHITKGMAKAEDIDSVEEITDQLHQMACCDYGKEISKVIEEVVRENHEVFEKHIKRKVCENGICEKLKAPEKSAENSQGLGLNRRRRR